MAFKIQKINKTFLQVEWKQYKWDYTECHCISMLFFRQYGQIRDQLEGLIIIFSSAKHTFIHHAEVFAVGGRNVPSRHCTL